MVAPFDIDNRPPASEVALPTPAVLHDRAQFGMLVYLTSKTMFFVALIGAYIVLANSQSWPPPDSPLTLESALPGTILLAISAATIFIATRGIRRDDQRAVRFGLTITLGLGLLFATLQVAEWFAASEAGLTASTYGQFYYVLTAFHMLYVVTGLGIFSVVLWRAMLGQYTPERRIGIDLSAIWWHFCGGVWALLFAAIYLLPESTR